MIDVRHARWVATEHRRASIRGSVSCVAIADALDRVLDEIAPFPLRSPADTPLVLYQDTAAQLTAARAELATLHALLAARHPDGSAL